MSRISVNGLKGYHFTLGIYLFAWSFNLNYTYSPFFKRLFKYLKYIKFHNINTTSCLKMSFSADSKKLSAVEFHKVFLKVKTRIFIKMTGKELIFLSLSLQIDVVDL